MHELQLIRDFYSTKVAERSRVPLISHIEEGLEILEELGASKCAKAAYCLHPMLQGDAEFTANYKRLANDEHISVASFALALWYRTAANAYLCKPSTDNWTQENIKRAVGHMPEDLRHMLIADKRQNQKDFMLYHFDTHARSVELAFYFYNWLEFLEAPAEPAELES